MNTRVAAHAWSPPLRSEGGFGWSHVLETVAGSAERFSRLVTEREEACPAIQPLSLTCRHAEPWIFASAHACLSPMQSSFRRGVPFLTSTCTPKRHPKAPKVPPTGTPDHAPKVRQWRRKRLRPSPPTKQSSTPKVDWLRTSEPPPRLRSEPTMPIRFVAKRLPLVSVAEFQFRYNNRSNGDIFGAAIEGC